eukprot:9484456-Pyramimonas_sp.AAC.1
MANRLPAGLETTGLEQVLAVGDDIHVVGAPFDVRPTTYFGPARCASCLPVLLLTALNGPTSASSWPAVASLPRALLPR